MKLIRYMNFINLSIAVALAMIYSKPLYAIIQIRHYPGVLSSIVQLAEFEILNRVVLAGDERLA